MRHLRVVRVLTVLALVAPASATVWTMSGPASATAVISCSVEKGTGLNAALSGCNDPANTGGKGSAVSKVIKGTSGSSTIKWNKTGTTTVAWNYTIVKPNKCAAGFTEIRETGKVTGGTGAAVKSITKGQSSIGTVCENAKGSSLLKGTVWTF